MNESDQSDVGIESKWKIIQKQLQQLECPLLVLDDIWWVKSLLTPPFNLKLLRWIISIISPSCTLEGRELDMNGASEIISRINICDKETSLDVFLDRCSVAKCLCVWENVLKKVMEYSICRREDTGRGGLLEAVAGDEEIVKALLCPYKGSSLQKRAGEINSTYSSENNSIDNKLMRKKLLLPSLLEKYEDMNTIELNRLLRELETTCGRVAVLGNKKQVDIKPPPLPLTTPLATLAEVNEAANELKELNTSVTTIHKVLQMVGSLSNNIVN